MIEDIELGLRLAAHGRTRLDPELQVTHLKRWTLRSAVATDVLCRAVPWSRLVLERGMPDDLNLRMGQRVAALVAVPALVALPAIPVAAALAPAWTALPAAIVALSVALNWDLLAFFARRRGLAFAAAAWALHQVHLAYSAATFALVAAGHVLAPRRAPA
jgi:hypothetical protein